MDITIIIQNVELKGVLEIPAKAESLVIFAHGSGSGRLSERNSFVARELKKSGMATLLFDLLTEKEDQVYENRFNIETLTERLIAVTKWCVESDRTRKLRIGYFGASTGAAAALSAAAYWGTKVKAIVCRGGRPDLAMEVLDLIESPTLLIVGGEDKQAIDLNRQAYQKIGAIKKIEVVTGATHLFEEPGTMEKVAEPSTQWFIKSLQGV